MTIKCTFKEFSSRELVSLSSFIWMNGWGVRLFTWSKVLEFLSSVVTTSNSSICWGKLSTCLDVEVLTVLYIESLTNRYYVLIPLNLKRVVLTIHRIITLILAYRSSFLSLDKTCPNHPSHLSLLILIYDTSTCQFMSSFLALSVLV